MAELNSDKNIKKKLGPILIRCISTKPGLDKVKFMFHTIANNKQLMINAGFVISDPNYEVKMQCIKEKKPFELMSKKEDIIKVAEAPKAEAPIVKVKRKRRSKTQIETDKKLQTA